LPPHGRITTATTKGLSGPAPPAGNSCGVVERRVALVDDLTVDDVVVHGIEMRDVQRAYGLDS
jgi:hypothetical protein